MNLLFVAGARPNFVKIAPLMRAASRYSDIDAQLVHTGQHYDKAMSEAFFDDLDIPRPNVNLDVGSGSHAVQTAEVMKRFEQVVLGQPVDLVVVVGDVNSTLACALTAVKLGISVAHVEAGLRSFDRSMPEEINRMLTDRISDYCFTTEPSAEQNLLREGVEAHRIFAVGNVMVDSLLFFLEKSSTSDILARLGLPGHRHGYALLTLHRPVNVDNDGDLRRMLEALNELAASIPIVFPAHPRTRLQMEKNGVGLSSRIRVIEPLGYLDFMHLMHKARMVLTDSGGIQEETTVLGVPCLTLRESTERPITISTGTNRLVGSDPKEILAQARLILSGAVPQGSVPELWDGRAAERILAILHRKLLDRVVAANQDSDGSCCAMAVGK